MQRRCSMSKIGDIRKREIIEAAIEVFGEKGFHRSKMGEIAVKTGIGKGTIYEYFSSKKELFEEMFKFIVDGYFKGAKEIFDGTESVKSRLIKFSTYHGRFMWSHYELAENTLKGSEPVSEGMKVYLWGKKKELFESIKGMLEDGINKKELKEGSNSDEVICMLIGSISQAYAHGFHKGIKDPDKVDPEPMIELLFRGIGRDNKQ
jgi:AcrR family transcriptional regulator